MNVNEYVMRANFPKEITSNPEWYRLAQRATEILSEEVRDTDVTNTMIPDLIVDWSMQAGTDDSPVFELKFSDIANDPDSVVATISLDGLRQEENLRQNLHRLWGQLLRQRSRRQVKSLRELLKNLDGE